MWFKLYAGLGRGLGGAHYYVKPATGPDDIEED